MSFANRIGAPRRRPRMKPVVVAALAASLLAACGSSSGSVRQSASADTVTPYAAAASASSGSAAERAVANFTGPVTNYPAVAAIKNVASLKGKTVWYVPLGEQVPILAAFGSAMQSALQHLGIETHVCDGMLLPTTVTSCLNQAVTQGAAAVVTGYVDYQMVPTAITNVVSHNIPLLVGGEADDAGPGASKLLGFYNTDPEIEHIARLSVDAAIGDSNGNAQILFVGAVDSPALVQLNADAATEARARCRSCAFHKLTYITPDLQKLPSEVSAALIRYPKTNYIVVAEDSAVQAVIEGVDSAGFGTKVKITAADGSLAPLQLIKSGQLVSQDIGVSPSFAGWGFADGVLRLMLGHAPVVYDAGIRVFDKQNVQGLSLTPGAYASNQWYGKSSFESHFLTAWAGK